MTGLGIRKNEIIPYSTGDYLFFFFFISAQKGYNDHKGQ
jgi:hypothetical protein